MISNFLLGLYFFSLFFFFFKSNWTVVALNEIEKFKCSWNSLSFWFLEENLNLEMSHAGPQTINTPRFNWLHRYAVSEMTTFARFRCTLNNVYSNQMKLRPQCLSCMATAPAPLFQFFVFLSLFLFISLIVSGSYEWVWRRHVQFDVVHTSTEAGLNMTVYMCVCSAVAVAVAVAEHQTKDVLRAFLLNSLSMHRPYELLCFVYTLSFVFRQQHLCFTIFIL